MKIFVLTSRYTATRDIIGEDFGRQTRLFSSLKKLGNEIDFFVADYRKLENKELKLNGINVKIRAFSIIRFFRFLSEINRSLKAKKYDFLVSSSDPLWGIIGLIFARRRKIIFVYDLHDNYETYATYKLPFFRYIDNYVLRKADIITTVSFTLKDKIKPIRSKDVFVMQNGVDLKLFRPMNMHISRKKLKLPKDAKIIGYAGSIQRLQGLNLLIGVFKEIKKQNKNLKLAVAGRFVKGEEKHIDLKQEGVIYLGSLPQDKIACFINACDVLAVPNPSNDFTKYCFPYKIVEYLACNKPVVATDIGDVGIFLKNHKELLCNENDRKSMKDALERQLNSKVKANYRDIALRNSWDKIAALFGKIMRKKIEKN